MAIHEKLAAEVEEEEARIRELNTGEAEVKPEQEEAVYEAADTGEAEAVEPTQQEEEADEATGEVDYESDDNPYKQRFKVLQGKYNAELPRERARAEEAESKLQEALAKPTEPDAADEDFDYPEFDERYARKDEVQSNQPDELAITVARKQMITELASIHPDWAEVNENPDFLTWLSEFDPHTGVQRQQSLAQAEAQFDGSTIADVISDWKATQRTTQKPDLRRKTIPSNARAGTPQGKATYSAVEAGAYIEGRNPGYLKKAGKGMDAQQFERELFAAEAEGRLI